MKRKTTPAPTDEEILSYNAVPPEIAAPYIGSSTPTIYRALQDERAPYGYAVMNPGTETWSYNISPGGLFTYKREGRPVIQLGELREMIADIVKEALDANMQDLSRIMRAVTDA